MNYEAALGALVTLLITAIIVERALSVLFGWRWWLKYFDGRGIKVPIAVAFSWAICAKYSFDAFAMAFEKTNGAVGRFITAMFIAGGSKLVLSVIRQVKAFQSQGKSGA